MTFHLKNLFVCGAFLLVLLLAVEARAGNVSPAFVWAGMAGVVAVEAALFFGILGRPRTR
jgi:hypothetical protein